MPTIYPFQQRVIDERADLDAKIKKLADFIVFSPSFKELDGGEKGRLHPSTPPCAPTLACWVSVLRHSRRCIK